MGERLHSLLEQLKQNSQAGGLALDTFHATAALHSVVCLVAAATKADQPEEDQALLRSTAGMALACLEHHYGLLEPNRCGALVKELLCCIMRVLHVPAAAFMNATPQRLHDSLPILAAPTLPGEQATEDVPEGLGLLQHLLGFLAAACESEQEDGCTAKGRGTNGDWEPASMLLGFVRQATTSLEICSHLLPDSATSELRFAEALAVAKLPMKRFARLLGLASPPAASQGTVAWLKAIPDKQGTAAHLLRWAREAAKKARRPPPDPSREDALVETPSKTEVAGDAALLDGLEKVVAHLEKATQPGLSSEEAVAFLLSAANEARVAEADQGVQQQPQLAACQQVLAALQYFAAERPDVALSSFVSGLDMRQLCCHCEPASPDAEAATQAREQQFARQEALARLAEAQAAAAQGQHQFLSGMLHNLAKVLAGDQQAVPTLQLRALGLRHRKGDGELVYSNLGEPSDYLSRMLTYIAEVGDELALIDAAPGEAHNYFALLDVAPGELARRLVGQHGCRPAVLRATARLGIDAAHEVLSAVLHPPLSVSFKGGGWAAFSGVLAHLRTGDTVDGNAASGDDSAVGTRAISSLRSAWLAEVEWLAGAEDGQRAWIIRQLSPRAGKVMRQLERAATPEQPRAKEAARRRKGRLPGISGGSMAPELRLNTDLLAEIATAAPARAALAAVVGLLQRRGGIALGELPLGPTAPDSAGEPVQRATEDAELLQYALKASEDRLPKLHSWLKLQLATNPALADLRTGPAGEFAALAPEVRRAQVKDLADAGSWEEAIQLAELEPGAAGPPDWLLEAAVDAKAPQLVPLARLPNRRPDTPAEVGRLRQLTHRWCWCIREGELLGIVALRHLRAWSLQQAEELLVWAATSAASGGALRRRLEDRCRLLATFKLALEQPAVLDEFQVWQQLDRMFESDAKHLSWRLAANGAPKAALEVALKAKLPPGFIRQARAGFLLSALQGPEPEPFGLLHVVKHLQQLPVVERATIGLAIIERLSSLKLSKALITVLLRDVGSLPAPTESALEAASLGVAALELVAEPWRGRLAHLVCAPHLLVETLVMAQELATAAAVLSKLPGLSDDAVILSYARKAVTFEKWGAPSAELESPGPGSSVTSPRASPSSPGGSPKLPGAVAASAVNSLTGAAPKALPILTGDDKQDEALRERHGYKTAPNARLATSITNLASSPAAGAQMCANLAAELLASELRGPWQRLKDVSSDLQRAREASTAAALVLEAGRGMLQDVSVDAGDLAVSGECELREQLERLTCQAQVLQALLTKQVPVSVDELEDNAKVKALVERLVQEEHYGLAAYVARRWQLDDSFVWEQWATALLEVGEYEEAEQCLANAFRLPPGAEEHAARAQRFVAALEATQPVNLRAMNEALEQRAAVLSQEEGPSLAAAAFLLVLQQTKSLPTLRQAAFESWPEARMEGRRYALGERLLSQHCPAAALGYMFRMGRAAAACRLLYPPRAAAASADESSHSPATLRYGDLEALLASVIQHEELRTLQRVLSEGGPRGREALHRLCIRAKAAVCSLTRRDASAPPAEHSDLLLQLQPRQLLLFLHRSYLALRSPHDAGLVCLRLAWVADTHAEAARCLRDATLHFRDTLAQLQKGYTPLKGGARLNAAQLTSLLTRIGLQVSLHKRLGSKATDPPELPRTIHLLLESEDGFGTTDDATAASDAHRRQTEVVCRLVPNDAELAFAVVHACGLAAGDAYSAAVKRLAEAGDAVGVEATLASIQGTTAPHEFDQVVLAAAGSFRVPPDASTVLSWAALLGRPAPDPVDALLAKIRSPQIKVTALLQLDRLSAAADCAVASRSPALVKTVADAARAADSSDALAVCERFLGR